MIRPPAGLSGTSTAPITVRALNDGQALLDAQFARIPVVLSNDGAGNNWWVLEGFNARNSNWTVIILAGRNNTLRRIVAWDAQINQNNHVLLVGGRDNLVEDCGFFGAARNVVNTYDDINPVFRRVWARWEGSTQAAVKYAFQLYYTQPGAVCENCLATWWPFTMPESYTLVNNGVPYPDPNNPLTLTNYTVEQRVGPMGQEGGSGSETTNTKFLASLSYHRGAVDFLTTSSSPTVMFLEQPSSVNVVRHVGVVVPSFTGASSIASYSLRSNGSNTDLSAQRITSLSQGGFDIGAQWSVSNHITGTSVSSLNSQGANPWTGTSGAQFCYRWVNGTQTTTPLWPWPMNERIKAATAAAGAYTGPCTGCNGGRRARIATDVTADIEALLGPIPAACRN